MNKHFRRLLFLVLAGLFLSLGIVSTSALPNQPVQTVITPNPPATQASEPVEYTEYSQVEPGSSTPRSMYLEEPPSPGESQVYNRPLVDEATSSLYIWQEVENPSGQNLREVSMLSATDGWAVGDYGAILHWDGTAWQVVASPTDYALYDIQMLSPTDGWIVGGHDQVNSLDVSIILHWDGVSWQPVASPTPLPLASISMLSSTDGWIVGGNYTSSIILHWNGSSWSIVPTGLSDYSWLIDVDMLSATDGWTVGNDGIILHWNGSAWNPVASPTTKYIIGIDMLTATDGWAVGGLWPEGEIYHWDGAAWSIVPAPPINEMLDVSMVSSSDGWAISYYGGQILHWDGSSWSLISNYSGRGIQMLSATDGWIVGYDILHYTEFNGLAVYVENASGLPAAYARVYALDSNGWSVGYGTTGVDGYAYLEVPPGSYDMLVRSTVDYFLITQAGVASPGITSMSALGTPQVSLTALQRDGMPLDNSGVRLGFSGADVQLRWSLGYTDSSGEMVFNVTPGFYDVGVVSWDYRYFVYTVDQDFTDPASTLDFDMSTDSSAEIAVGHPYDSVSDLGLIPANGSYGFLFSDLADGDSIVVSTGLGYAGFQQLNWDDLAGNHWEYSFENYTYTITLGPGEVFTFSVGGPLTFTGRTDDAYVGSSIQLTETVDSFGSLLTYIIRYTPDYSDVSDIPPQANILNPDAYENVVDWNWYYLPATAPTGTYSLDAAWDTGPYQGLLEATSQFEVLPQQVSAVITAAGGMLFSSWDGIAYDFPAGAFSEDVIVTHTVRYTDIPPFSPWKDIGRFFDISAVYVSTSLPAEPSIPYTISIPYSDWQASLVLEDSLALYFWNGAQWQLEASSVADPLNNLILAEPDHFSTWGVLDDSIRLYLAIIQK